MCYVLVLQENFSVAWPASVCRSSIPNPPNSIGWSMPKRCRYGAIHFLHSLHCCLVADRPLLIVALLMHLCQLPGTWVVFDLWYILMSVSVSPGDMRQGAYTLAIFSLFDANKLAVCCSFSMLSDKTMQFKETTRSILVNSSVVVLAPYQCCNCLFARP